jgi:hypothetical protein
MEIDARLQSTMSIVAILSLKQRVLGNFYQDMARK